ncbi:MAG: hypothetical protein UHM85_00895 [Acutalibacteraceae bacterium]|nr:hypothetical protein [Acutalibacteraceae bacterium]
MTFIYCLIRYLTFPGAYVRAMWEQTVLRRTKTVVEDNRYLRDDELSGHVEHEFTEKAQGSFALCFVPLFLNCVGIFSLLIFPSVIGASSLAATILSSVSVWFAFSLFCNSFPLIEDAMNMLEKVYKKGNILQKIIYAPGAAICFVGAYLERYSITFIIGIIGIVLIFS